MKDLMLKTVACVGICLTITSSQTKNVDFEVYYIPLTITNCMASYTESEVEQWHDLTSIFKPRSGESHLVSILEKADEPCVFKPYDVRLKMISKGKKYLMDQSGCVASSTGNKSLTRRGIYDLKWFIDDRLPSQILSTYGTKEADSLVPDQYRTSGTTIQAVGAAWNNLSTYQQDRHYSIEDCMVEVNDAGTSVKVDFLIPITKDNKDWSFRPVKAITYWVDKESSQILNREEKELPKDR